MNLNRLISKGERGKVYYPDAAQPKSLEDMERELASVLNVQ